MSPGAPGAPDDKPRQAYVPAAGARLFARAVGIGVPIVVVHGGPTFDHNYFLPELDRLADLARLVYYDQRGRGRSFAGQRADDVTLASEMTDLDAIRAWTASDSVAVLGHSWGTLLALEYATRHRERVSHLILLNPAPASHADRLLMVDHLTSIRSPEVRERMAALRADPEFLAGDIGVESRYYGLHFEKALVRPEHRVTIVGRLRTWSTPEGIVAARAIEERLYQLTWDRPAYDLLPRLRSLQAPTLVLTGEHDFIPVDVARHIADAVPGSHFVLVPDCGHFSFLEAPDAVHRAVADILA